MLKANNLNKKNNDKNHCKVKIKMNEKTISLFDFNSNSSSTKEAAAAAAAAAAATNIKHSEFLLNGLQFLKSNNVLCDVTLVAESN